ncbi:hypothetical protein SARC_11061 [Sphaeroforma arctica JP610]|uniref:FAS1 domain-containing protein n=1 Tax=Sphaeroforma arctica JP610 TaxID=667725 RepID=A0A0L0FI27_9EUKA|nr:hypothetical protein SARC_11061 [Sphaeroforma arctica JP610]KNC76439.1 hypothetical protein SARC_11061 [Sphaeroforma arctica JP610]|eukprot:XP_014150341.1 hypothetical protein SARC_11061 [Sphaeroforma arctica JP610]
MKVLQYATLATAALVNSVIGKSVRDTCNGTLKTKLVDLATESAVLQTLVASVSEADLLDLLAGSVDYTIFAPTDDAFQALDETLIMSDMSLVDVVENKELLTNILALHFVPLEYSSDELKEGQQLESVGGPLTISLLDGGSVTGPTNTANFIALDLVACNGVVHVIDTVLLPATDGMTISVTETEGDIYSDDDDDGDDVVVAQPNPNPATDVDGDEQQVPVTNVDGDDDNDDDVAQQVPNTNVGDDDDDDDGDVVAQVPTTNNVVDDDDGDDDDAVAQQVPTTNNVVGDDDDDDDDVVAQQVPTTNNVGDDDDDDNVVAQQVPTTNNVGDDDDDDDDDNAVTQQVPTVNVGDDDDNDTDLGVEVGGD